MKRLVIAAMFLAACSSGSSSSGGGPSVPPSLDSWSGSWQTVVSVNVGYGGKHCKGLGGRQSSIESVQITGDSCVVVHQDNSTTVMTLGAPEGKFLRTATWGKYVRQGSKVYRETGGSGGFFLLDGSQEFEGTFGWSLDEPAVPNSICLGNGSVRSFRH